MVGDENRHQRNRGESTRRAEQNVYCEEFRVGE